MTNQNQHPDPKQNTLPLKHWTSLAEQRIQEGLVDGSIKPKEGHGVPLPEWDPNDKDWWLKQKCRNEGLTILPPALQLKLDVEKRLEKAMEAKSKEVFIHSVEALNRFIKDQNMRIGWGPSSDVQEFKIDELLSVWSGEKR